VSASLNEQNLSVDVDDDAIFCDRLRDQLGGEDLRQRGFEPRSPP
jgi:hypothetical protein